MHGGRKISLILMGCILLIFIIYGTIELPMDLCGAIIGNPSRTIISYAQRLWFPGLSYESSGKSGDGSTWMIERASEIFPLGSYMTDRNQTEPDVEDRDTYAMILKNQANDENAVDENGNLVGEEEPIVTTSVSPIDTSLASLENYEYLLGNFYTVDSSTMVDETLLNADTLLSKNMQIDTQTDGPKILIYHTHSQETFADSVPGDTETSIVGIGRYLTDLLNQKYEISTMHHEGVYDLVDGVLDRSMAYDLAEPEIEQILADHPTIEVVIDLHRDGVAEDTHLVTEINGKPTAQIMFFNGLSRTRANGEIDYLPNPYIEDNLAFSLQLQIAAAEKYPGFTRHIYLRGYRYNMHLLPKTLLIEAGAQTNTVEEMKNAMEVLADILDGVLTGKK